MSRNVYIGNGGTARRVKTIRLGVLNASRSVTRAYVGIDGAARLIYPTYMWQRYTVSTVTTYAESRSQEGKITSWSPGVSTNPNNFPSEYCYTSYTFDTNSGNYSFSGWEQPPVYYGYTNVSGYYYNGYELTRTEGYRIISSQRATSNAYGRAMQSYAVSQQVRGSYVDTVYGSVASQYPIDGIHTDGYWYVAV